MSNIKVSPYIQFSATAAQAIQLYESALGAKVENRILYGEVPGMNPPPAHKDLVMHAALRIGEGVVMVSDTPPGKPPIPEGNVHVLLDFADVAEMTKAFAALAAGAKILQPLQDTFWGAKFGTLTDAYGVRWMFNCVLKK